MEHLQGRWSRADVSYTKGLTPRLFAHTWASPWEPIPQGPGNDPFGQVTDFQEATLVKYLCTKANPASWSVALHFKIDGRCKFLPTSYLQAIPVLILCPETFITSSRWEYFSSQVSTSCLKEEGEAHPCPKEGLFLAVDRGIDNQVLLLSCPSSQLYSLEACPFPESSLLELCWEVPLGLGACIPALFHSAVLGLRGVSTQLGFWAWVHLKSPHILQGSLMLFLRSYELLLPLNALWEFITFNLESYTKYLRCAGEDREGTALMEHDLLLRSWVYFVS